MRRHRLRAALPFKKCFGMILDFFLPLPNLGRMDAKLQSNFVECLYPSYGFKTTFVLGSGVWNCRCFDSLIHLFPVTEHSLNHCLEKGITILHSPKDAIRV
jgi:hypothetical protein